MKLCTKPIVEKRLLFNAKARNTKEVMEYGSLRWMLQGKDEPVDESVLGGG